MPGLDSELREKVSHVFEELAEDGRRFRLQEFHIYRENTLRSLAGDGATEFPEISLDEIMPEGKVRIEAYFEEVETERRIIASIASSVRSQGTFQHSEDVEISYIDTMPGDAGPDGVVPAPRLEPVVSAIPGLCNALVSILNATLNFKRPTPK
jgi:hypothetical protein